MNHRTRQLIVMLALLTAGLVWCGGALAEGPYDEISDALWDRLTGQLTGPWIGVIPSDSYVTPGEDFEWVVYYDNEGGTRQGAVLKICLPSQVGGVQVESDPAVDCQFDEGTDCLECALGTLDPREGGVVRITNYVQEGTLARTELRCEAQILVNGQVVDGGSSDTVIVTAPEIECTVDGPASVLRCQDFNYILNYVNTGNLGAVNLTVTMTLPIGFQFLYASPAPVRVGNLLVWDNLDALPVDGNEGITISMRVPQNNDTLPGTLVSGAIQIVEQLNEQASVSSACSADGIIIEGPCSVHFPNIGMYHDPTGTERDAYEYDDKPELARAVATDGQPMRYTLHKPLDEDWVRFLSEPGATYRIEVYDLVGAEPPEGWPAPAGWVPRTDTVLDIYEPRLDPTSPYITDTLACHSDDLVGTPTNFGSACTIISNTRGWYHVRVRQYLPDDPYGDEWKYDWTLEVYGWKRYFRDTGYTLRIQEVDTLAGARDRSSGD